MARKNKKKENPSSPKIPFLLLEIIGDTILFPLKILVRACLLLTKPHVYKHCYQAINIFRRILHYGIIKMIRFLSVQFALSRLMVRFFISKIRHHFSFFHRSLPKKKILYVASHNRVSFPSFKRQKKFSFPVQPVIRHKTKIPLLTRFIYIIFGGAIVFFLIVIPLSLYTIVKALPNPQLLRTRDIQVTTKIFDRHGGLLYEIFSDENRTPIPLSQIPEKVKHATIAIEDKNFYHHNGFSFSGIMRAAWETVRHKRLQGGSTITQQLIKSTLLTPEVTISRKIKEVILAFWTEQLYTKNQILEMYLNQVPYGGTAWGVESASQTYFGKSVKEITLAEAALLTGLPQAPSDYSPFSGNKEKAIERQGEVLRRMVEDGYISTDEAENAKKETLSFKSPATPIKAPHFVWYVKDYLEKKYGKHMVEKGGLHVTTSLDNSLQEKVQALVTSHIDSLAPLQVGNGAALVTNPKTGEILAMIGSRDYFDTARDGNVNVTTALRQPGSSIKVVTYAKALENKSLTSTTLIEDTPVVYPIAGQPPYAPVNYDGRFHGMVPTRLALANSYNIPAVKILNMIGVDSMIEQAKLMGIDTWTERSRFGLSLTLGGGEVTMTDMAELYGTLANLGKRKDLNPILSVTDYAGKTIEKNTAGTFVQALSPEVSWIMGNILSDNWARTQAFGPNSQLVIPNKTVAVKTGTTNDKRDNWTIGYTPSYVVTVWVGNNDNTPMHPHLTSGITGAAPIWHDIMIELLKDKADETFSKPDGVITMPCYGNRTEYFVKGTEPRDKRCGFIPTTTPSQSP